MTGDVVASNGHLHEQDEVREEHAGGRAERHAHNRPEEPLREDRALR
jgi:hypothetical protein